MKSFLHGKSALATPALRLPPGLVAATGPRATPSVHKGHASTGHHGEPLVETVKEGDKVVRLVITCGCGERIEIECLYPAGG
ncbi:MAG: hypothetical protein HZA93_04025 [Verrucomicrobia bacterium]|nr:hypothetical protein [Verrucomicrobiota bacterium]